MTNLSMQYLGLKLKGPIVVASTPLSDKIDNLRHMEAAGASAVVLTSLFEEQLELEARALDDDLARGTYINPEALDFLPEQSDYHTALEFFLFSPLQNDPIYFLAGVRNRGAHDLA